jgi:hypothetical protein
MIKGLLAKHLNSPDKLLIFLQGCDGSILLDKTATIDTEKEAFANNNSARGFDVVDIMKERLEGVCPDTVSCADILAIAAEESVVLVCYITIDFIRIRNQLLFNFNFFTCWNLSGKQIKAKGTEISIYIDHLYFYSIYFNVLYGYCRQEVHGGQFH